MKAHIPAKAALSKQSKQAVKEYVDSYEKDCMRRFLKLSCVALHTDEKDPHGKKRLARYLKKITELAQNDDEIFWYHVDKLLIDQLGIQFEREDAK